jgi:hypothetical protein
VTVYFSTICPLKASQKHVIGRLSLLRNGTVKQLIKNGCSQNKIIQFCSKLADEVIAEINSSYYGGKELDLTIVYKRLLSEELNGKFERAGFFSSQIQSSSSSESSEDDPFIELDKVLGYSVDSMLLKKMFLIMKYGEIGSTQTLHHPLDPNSPTYWL